MEVLLAYYRSCYRNKCMMLLIEKIKVIDNVHFAFTSIAHGPYNFVLILQL